MMAAERGKVRRKAAPPLTEYVTTYLTTYLLGSRRHRTGQPSYSKSGNWLSEGLRSSGEIPP
jgi:hypothetical protein